ncbi:ParB/RepB/Spo0J family partition protein [Gammaproteobacteria bacterium]|jgi:ParB family chromosome partitioning protein|nr:ParB/RepB/Spo0J family partition protein [Gammaproteobacteria bacterium]|tara:strand:+ start:393 stop:1241 length:849 start_codon:yes stop_codon:yes gene_type:complete
MTKRKALGSGLDSLLSSTRQTQTTTPEAEGNLPSKIQVHKIKRNRHQPRKVFKEDEIKQLAESIRENGQIAPIVVRKIDDNYELIVGERRWRATQLLKKETINAVVIEADEKTSAVLSIVENVQREDLNSMEEAESLDRLIKEFDMSHEDVAKYISKSRTHVTNIIRLNDLSDFVKEQLRENNISMGHARAVITLSDDEQSKIIREAIHKKLSVRAVENLAKPNQKSKISEQKNQDTLALERRLTETLGAKTTINNGKKGGVVNIRYGSLDELQGIIDKIGK